MRDVDVLLATEILTRIAPSLGEELRVARAAEPESTESEALDRALRASLAGLQHELNQQTFEFLRHKVLVARGNTDRALASLRATSEAQRRWRMPDSSPLLDEPTGADRPAGELPRVWAEHRRFTQIEESIRSRLSVVLAPFAADDRRDLIAQMAVLQMRYELLDAARRGNRS